MKNYLKIITSVQFVSSMILIIFATVFIIIVRHFYRRYVSKLSEKSIREKGIAINIYRLIKTVTILLTGAAVLQANGINISSMIAGVGIAGAVVGFAMQDFLKDVIMGFHIINDKSFTVGDVIKCNGDEGIVISFTLLSTQMISLNTGDKVTMCNRNIMQVSKSMGIYDINLPLPYEEDKEKIGKVLTDISGKISLIDGISNCEYLGIQKYQTSSILYKLRFKCDPKDKWTMWRAAMRVVQKGLDESKISIPYNRLDIRN